jgi:2-oxoglutarate ferredoxin oxidoreductase subunit gamma
MRREFVATGFGGQGIVLMGVTACIAAGKYDRKNVTQTQSYGPASRGGACRTDVVISDERIDYAKALSPDLLIVMSNQARDKYISDVDPEQGIVIVDSTLVQEMPDKLKRLYRVPATEIAEMQLGQRIVANMVMLGAAAAIGGLFTRQALESAIQESPDPKRVDANLRAVDAGYEFGKSLLSGSPGLEADGE